MHTYNKEIGNLGESAAAEYLYCEKYEVITRNFRSRFGEVDIIARDGKYIVFVEVKTRYNSIYGSPGEAVNYTKITKLRKTAEYYIIKNKLYKDFFRFDVIEVYIDYNDNSQTIKHIKNAFQV
jgi:putative endonuclease